MFMFNKFTRQQDGKRNTNLFTSYGFTIVCVSDTILEQRNRVATASTRIKESFQ